MNIKEFIARKYNTTDNIETIVNKCRPYISFSDYSVTEEALKFNDVMLKKDILLTGTNKKLLAGSKLAALDFTNTDWIKVYENNTDKASYIIVGGNPILEAVYMNPTSIFAVAWSDAMPHLVELVNIIKSMRVEDIREFTSRRGQSVEERIFAEAAKIVMNTSPEELGAANGV